MLKTYGEKPYDISRFMDGLAVNLGIEFMYLEDASGEIRIGKPSFIVINYNPVLELQDTESKRTIWFQGDWHDQYSSCMSGKFSWFPAIKKAGILYSKDVDEIERGEDVNTNLMSFLRYEMFLRIAGQKNLPVGGNARSRIDRDEPKKRETLWNDIEGPAWLYTWSFESLYAMINKNNDVLLGLYGLKNTPELPEKIEFCDNLERFIQENPLLIEALNFGSNKEGSGDYSASIKGLQDGILKDVLEEFYIQFVNEVRGRKMLEHLRESHPREELERKLKDVDTKHPHAINLSTYPKDLRSLSGIDQHLCSVEQIDK